MKKSIIPFFALCTFLVGCTSEPANVGQQKKPLVKVMPASVADVEQQAEFTGTIEPFLINNISPSLGLRIDNIHVDVGDKVTKGQLLVEMDKRQYMQASVQLANLESDYLRTESLYQQGGVSKQQLDQMATQLEVSRHAAGNLLENVNLTSPIYGVVTERVYDPGDVYSPGIGKILTVMQLDRVKVKVNVSEQYYPQVKHGMPVDIKLDIYPNQVFEGKVSLIYPSLDAATHTVPVEITIPNASTKLRPGMFSRVTLNFGKMPHVVVDDIAVQKQIGTNERYVFIIDSDTTAVRRPVTIGRVLGNKYEILTGINDGENVVTAGMSKLLDGSKVEITTK